MAHQNWRRRRPIPGWNASALSNPRPPAVPATLNLTLGEYFAAKALPALIELCREDTLTNGTFPDHCARYAYEMADAMLKARAA